MKSLTKKMVRLNAFAAGVLLGLCIVTPAFAATFAFDALPARDWLLMGSLVLLAIALALRIMRRRGPDEAAPDDPPADLRWWRNPETEAY